MTFYDGVAPLGTAPVAGNEAALSSILLPAGARKLHAYYSGDSTYSPSTSSTVSETVTAGGSLGFRHPLNYSLAHGGQSFVVGDFNGDGHQDVAIATSSSVGVMVLLGKGDGSFQPAADYSVQDPIYLTAGDFNGDGNTDLAVSEGTAASVAVLLGNGDGTFQAAVAYSTGTTSTGPLVTGDFNLDGKTDLAVASGATNISILLGDGTGAFGTARVAAFAVSGYLTALAVGDFNGDGKPDVAATLYNYVVVLLGDGSGGLASPVSYFVTSGTGSIAVADLNNDGASDLVVGSPNSALAVMLGKGDGTFNSPVAYSAGVGQPSISIGDFNGDGMLDVAASNSYNSTFNVLMGNGDGTFGAAVSYAISSANAFIAAGEFNGDGKTDLVILYNTVSGNSLTVMLGGAVPDLSISASHGGGFTQGQSGTYTLTVTNVGEAATTGTVGITITLAAGLTGQLPASVDGWTCGLGCTRSDALAPGASYTTIPVTISVDPSLSGNVSNTFTVSGGGDQNTTNNTASDTVFIRFATSTTLTSAPNSSTLGQAVTLTATVSAGTGKVMFYDGTTVLGAAALAGRQAIFTTASLASGTRLLHAEYLGDSTYGPSISATRNQTVNAITSTGLQPYVAYQVGSSPNGVVAADFNGDGKADLATANTTGSVSILLGNGDGTFRGAVNYASANNPSSLVVGDFNGDGIPDLASGGSNGIGVLLGNGDGTFQAATISNSGTAYSQLASADFNGDGQQDLVALNNNSVVALPGSGDGTFQAPVPVTPGGIYLTVLAVADMNGDGKPDLVTSGNQSIGVLFGNGDGSFRPAISTAISYSPPTAFAVGDFNGDGKPDVVAIYWGTGAAVLSGKGDGSFQSPITSNLSTGSTPAYTAIAGDFNGDGKLDIAYGGYYNNEQTIAFGKGDGTFQSGFQFPTDSYFAAFALGDFNSDGKPDFAVANSSGNTVDVFVGGQFSGLNISSVHSGSFTIGQTGTYQLTVSNSTFAGSTGTITVTDTLPAGLTASAVTAYYPWSCSTPPTVSCTYSNTLNSLSSTPTITVTVSVSANLSAGTITNVAAVSSGSFVNSVNDPTVLVTRTTMSMSASPNPSILGQPVSLSANVTTGATGTVTFFDGAIPLGTAGLASGQATMSTRLLGPGLRELTATYSGDSSHASSSSAVLLLTVNSALTSGLSAATTYFTGNAPEAVVIADLNSDGNADLIAANSTGNSVSVLVGNGDGTFRSKVDYAVGSNPVAIVSGDFNNDGKTDVAVANQSGNSLSVLLGNGDGTFRAPVNYATGTTPAALAVGDLNGDGKPDLVVGNQGNGTITPFLGNGDGTFRAAASISYAYSVNALALADFNHDGQTDIVYGANGIYVLPGNGDGTFQSSLYFSGSYTNALVVSDINADGKPDVVTSDSTGVNVYVGKGDGTLQPLLHYPDGASPAGLVTADINGDGKLDVLCTNSGGSSISVFLGNGDGTLQSALTYSVGSRPRGLAAGDFNGDGRADLAVANSQNNDVSVLLGVLTPVLSVSSSHVGGFAFGQQGAVYTLMVANAGPGSTSGAISVSDTLPMGLSATAISGTGWNCNLALVTCSRSDTLAPTQSYPPITLQVNVTLASPTTVTNQISASGGGSPPASATDSTTVSASSLAVMASPAPNTTLPSGTVVFNWSPGSGGSAFWLDVGTVQGQGNIFAANLGLATTQTVSGIPTNGTTVYLRLWTLINGSWSPNDYTYTAFIPKAVMSVPTPGSTLPGTSVTFTWSAVTGADQYWLDVGTSVGVGNLCAGATTSLSSTCSSIPANGSTIYVQLWTHIFGTWQTPIQYTYMALPVPRAQLTAPLNHSVFSGSSVTFTWGAVAGADQYWLDVGTSIGQGNLCAGATAGLSSTCSSIPTNGSTIYVQLWTHISGAWQTPIQYSFTAVQSTRAQLTSPANNSTLAGSSVTFTWGVITGADQYWLDVGNSVGVGNLCAGATSNTFSTCSSIPTDGRTIYVQLWTHISGAWQTPIQYTFTSFNNGRAQLISPVNNSLLIAGVVTFTWTAVTGADQYWLDVGTSFGQGNICGGATTSTSSTCSGVPPSGTIYVQLWTHKGGVWQTPIQYTFTGG